MRENYQALLVQIDDEPEGDEELDQKELQIFARKCGLIFNIPPDNSIAQKRLIIACKEFIKSNEESKVRIMPSDDYGISEYSERNVPSYYLLKKQRRIDTSLRVIREQESVRREWHDKLCQMIAGKIWQNTDYDTRIKISDFAAYAAGREDLVKNF